MKLNDHQESLLDYWIGIQFDKADELGVDLLKLFEASYSKRMFRNYGSLSRTQRLYILTFDTGYDKKLLKERFDNDEKEYFIDSLRNHGKSKSIIEFYDLCLLPIFQSIQFPKYLSAVALTAVILRYRNHSYRGYPGIFKDKAIEFVTNRLSGRVKDYISLVDDIEKFDPEKVVYSG